MPALSMYKLSAPTDPKEFENMLIDYSSNVYKGRATLLGRQGQTQHGIDVVVTRDDYSIVCLQCKDVNSKSVTINNIKKWILEADSSNIKIALFVIVVATERDASIQEFVYLEMQKRVSQGKFPVEIVFWDDIQHFLKTNINIFQIYYPFLYLNNQNYSSVLSQIKDVNQLKDKFFDLIVKYKIEEFLYVDIFVGFPVELVVLYDSFEVEVQQLLYKAISMKTTNIYNIIEQIKICLNNYSMYLGTLGEIVNGQMVRVLNSAIRREYAIYEKDIITRRDEILKLIKEIIII